VGDCSPPARAPALQAQRFKEKARRVNAGRFSTFYFQDSNLEGVNPTGFENLYREWNEAIALNS
jgi:hypothetical protein